MSKPSSFGIESLMEILNNQLNDFGLGNWLLHVETSSENDHLVISLSRSLNVHTCSSRGNFCQFLETLENEIGRSEFVNSILRTNRDLLFQKEQKIEELENELAQIKNQSLKHLIGDWKKE